MPDEIKTPFIPLSRMSRAMGACVHNNLLSEAEVENIAIAMAILRSSLEAARNPFYNGEQKQMAAGIVATFRAHGGDIQLFYNLMERI